MSAEESLVLGTDHSSPELSDSELERQTEQALQILSARGVTAQNMIRHLSTVRAQVVTEHYGADFLELLEKLRESYSEQTTSSTSKMACKMARQP